MSYEECLEAIGILRSEREALRAEAIKRKQEKEKGNIMPKEPRKPKEKTATPQDDFLAGLLGTMKGEGNGS